MFVFSGTFFDVQRFPFVIEVIAWLLPMTHLIAVIRPLVAGTELGLLAALGHILYQLVLTVLAFWLAHRRLHRRLYD